MVIDIEEGERGEIRVQGGADHPALVGSINPVGQVQDPAGRDGGVIAGRVIAGGAVVGIGRDGAGLLYYRQAARRPGERGGRKIKAPSAQGGGQVGGGGGGMGGLLPALDGAVGAQGAIVMPADAQLGKNAGRGVQAGAGLRGPAGAPTF